MSVIFEVKGIWKVLHVPRHSLTVAGRVRWSPEYLRHNWCAAGHLLASALRSITLMLGMQTPYAPVHHSPSLHAGRYVEEDRALQHGNRLRCSSSTSVCSHGNLTYVGQRDSMMWPLKMHHYGGNWTYRHKAQKQIFGQCDLILSLINLLYYKSNFLLLNANPLLAVPCIK